MLLTILAYHRKDALKLRRIYLEKDHAEMAENWSATIRDIDKLVGELVATREEMGWR